MVAAVGNGTQAPKTAVGLRRLPGRAAARARRRRGSGRTAPCRTTRTATRSTSTSPPPAARSSPRSRATSSTRRSTGCTAEVAYSELRPVGVPGRDRHVVRGAAGRRRRRLCCSASTRSSRRTRSSGSSSARRPTPAPRRAARRAPSAATRSPAGARSTSRPRSSCSATGTTCRPPTRSSRTTTPAPPPTPSGAAHDHRDARLLGRPGRRLLDHAQGRARRCSPGSASAPARPTSLLLWKPGTVHVTGPPRDGPREPRRARRRQGGQQRLAYVGARCRDVLPRGAMRRADACAGPLRALGRRPSG